MTKGLAPIALFVFKRPDHTSRVLEALRLNNELQRSPLYIFSDGPRGPGDLEGVMDVRVLVSAFDHPNKIVVSSERNSGLAKSIVGGVSRLCEEYGKVIVLEDDLIVSPVFLKFMNDALEFYESDERIMQISGHMFPARLNGDRDALLLPLVTSWGWATWSRAWKSYEEDEVAAKVFLKSYRWRVAFDFGGSYPFSQMLARRMNGVNNSWAVWWYFSVFRLGGLGVFPTRTLVNNVGFDGSGTHCGAVKGRVEERFAERHFGKYPLGNVLLEDVGAVKAFLMRDRGVWKNVVDMIGRILASRRL